MPKLPEEILTQRLENELYKCKRQFKHTFECTEPAMSSFPLEFNVELVDAPGPIWGDGELEHRYSHRFVMKITDNYPWEKPWIIWQSPVFHPNFQTPEDGGKVCVNLMDDWGFQSTLVDFIRFIEKLLLNPDPDHPWSTETNQEAAEFFKRNPYQPPESTKKERKKPAIVSGAKPAAALEPEPELELEPAPEPEIEVEESSQPALAPTLPGAAGPGGGTPPPPPPPPSGESSMAPPPPPGAAPPPAPAPPEEPTDISTTTGPATKGASPTTPAPPPEPGLAPQPGSEAAPKFEPEPEHEHEHEPAPEPEPESEHLPEAPPAPPLPEMPTHEKMPTISSLSDALDALEELWNDICAARDQGRSVDTDDAEHYYSRGKAAVIEQDFDAVEQYIRKSRRVLAGEAIEEPTAPAASAVEEKLGMEPTERPTPPEPKQQPLEAPILPDLPDEAPDVALPDRGGTASAAGVSDSAAPLPTFPDTGTTEEKTQASADTTQRATRAAAGGTGTGTGTGTDTRTGTGDGAESAAAAHEETASAAQQRESGLLEGLTFDQFVVGGGNKLANAACMAVASNPGTTYNPLFIYSDAGLGKTHLLNAIGHEVRKRDPTSQVIYTTSEKFTNELIKAIRYEKIEEFRERYRSNDLLLIDDIQFLTGQERTQEEFFHTFNALYNANRQIVVASDRPPEEIDGLETRLVSRFKGGLITDIQVPDVETRTSILMMMAEQENIAVPDEVVNYIAKQITSNIRELKGGMQKVLAFASLSGSPVTMTVTKQALGTKKAKKEGGAAAAAARVSASEGAGAPPRAGAATAAAGPVTAGSAQPQPQPQPQPQSQSQSQIQPQPAEEPEEEVEELEELEAGFSYLVEEERPKYCLELYEHYLQKIGRGLLITRSNPRLVTRQYELEEAKIYWLTDRTSSIPTISPRLETMIYTLEDFLEIEEEGILMLDGVEYLISNTNFDPVLKFLREIVDEVSESTTVFIVPINPFAINKQELSMLERELISISKD